MNIVVLPQAANDLKTRQSMMHLEQIDRIALRYASPEASVRSRDYVTAAIPGMASREELI